MPERARGLPGNLKRAYSLPISIDYPRCVVGSTRAAAEPVHLVEIEIEGSAEGFDFGEITQEVPGQPRNNWQAVYDEREVGQNRFAFFFHYLDTAKPLLSPAGLLALPRESPVPEHLQGIENEQP